ncbi:MAG: hypothetical protein FJW39_03640 [Acidobacteria bacterium]|nr:hypothetical protein [Acidobacteriota bacterium]
MRATGLFTRGRQGPGCSGKDPRRGFSARRCCRAGFGFEQIAAVVHRIWPDVCRPGTRAGDLYLKLTVVDDVLVVSFKRL